MIKYYFFRDLDHEGNLLDGKTYHAAGFVKELFCEIGEPNPSGKDLAVCFFEPFTTTITSAWRALDEVELFEVEEWEYNNLVENLEALKN